ncbi:hypothetical protein QR680_004010 [Steinernema hermaphroditum]|uniref:Peptidase M14 domain-containing protein n=1 Tax=Steinernema hermaphroditum TaxID=289476 RepID=A0AA39HMD2_9BILA|nr:hypothetical protein QR680_004010 [Steinernema hermaphroditum]
MKTLCSIGLFGLLLSLGSTLKSYDGHSVISIKTSTEEHVKAIQEMEAKEGLRGLDFWKEPRKVKGTVDVRVAPEHRMKMEAFLLKHGLEYSVKLLDLGDVIRHEREVLKKRTIFKEGDFPSKLTLGQFHNLEEIHSYLRSVAARNNSSVSLINIGKSFQGRDLLGVKIGNPGPNKRATLMHGCLHSREWIGCSTMLFIINELTQNSQKYTSLLNSLDIYIIPVANPDGYQFTWTEERLWRKTLSGPYGEDNCYGVDPNRNWDFQFKVSGYSNDPCSETYAGPYGFSEVEPKAIADFLTQHKNSIKAYFDVHSYSEYFMYSYGYAYGALPKDWKRLDAVAAEAVQAIEAVHGQRFKYGPIVDVIYPASGSSVDWAKGVLNVTYPYALELRPDENAVWGFIVNQDQIIPAAQECWAGLQVVLHHAVFDN